MKLTVLTVALILLLIPSDHRVNQQDPPSPPEATEAIPQEFQELEAKLKEIDELPDSANIVVTGDEDNIRVERIVTTRTTPKSGVPRIRRGLPRMRGGREIRAITTRRQVTLLNIDLSKIRVPDEVITEKILAAFSKPSSSGRCPGVKVTQIDAGANYKVAEDYTYNRGTYSITAPEGFIYDRASIPRVFWVIIDKDSLSNAAPLFHDLLYRNGGVLPNNLVSPPRTFSREEADYLFLDLMEKCGVRYVRRMAAYKAVRTLAKSSWQERQP